MIAPDAVVDDDETIRRRTEEGVRRPGCRRPRRAAGPGRRGGPGLPTAAPITSVSTARSSAGWPGRRRSRGSTSRPSNAGRSRPTGPVAVRQAAVPCGPGRSPPLPPGDRPDRARHRRHRSDRAVGCRSILRRQPGERPWPRGAGGPPRWLDGAAAASCRQLDRWRVLRRAPLLWTYGMTDQQGVIDADVDTVGRTALGRRPDPPPGAPPVRLSRVPFGVLPPATGGQPDRRPAGPAGRLVWKGVPGLDLSDTLIGRGLFISHGQNTILSAERIGANLQVHQGVTVGWDYRGDGARSSGTTCSSGPGPRSSGP